MLYQLSYTGPIGRKFPFSAKGQYYSNGDWIASANKNATLARVSLASVMKVCYDEAAMRGFAFAVVRRLLIIIPVLWAVVTLVFLLIHIVPGDPAQTLVGENATPENDQARLCRYVSGNARINSAGRDGGNSQGKPFR